MLFKNNFPKFRIKLNVNFGFVHLYRRHICFGIEIRVFDKGFHYAKDFYFNLQNNGVLDDRLYNRVV